MDVKGEKWECGSHCVCGVVGEVVGEDGGGGGGCCC